MYTHQHFTQVNKGGNLSRYHPVKNKIVSCFTNIREPGIKQFYTPNKQISTYFFSFIVLQQMSVNFLKVLEQAWVEHTEISQEEQTVDRENTNMLVWIKASWNSFIYFVKYWFLLIFINTCPDNSLLVYAFLQSFSLYIEFCELQEFCT